jgi:hypothetical protein
MDCKRTMEVDKACKLIDVALTSSHALNPERNGIKNGDVSKTATRRSNANSSRRENDTTKPSFIIL